MGKYKITRLIYSLLTKIGLIHFGHFVFHLWFQWKPTQEMKDERKFFSDHAHELEEVYYSLEDDASRLVFENILRFRVTSKWKYLKSAGGGKDCLKTQYFVPEVQFSDHEVIVDCGAFNGDTVKRFYELIPGCRVIAIEPDERNFAQLQQLQMSKYSSLKVYKCGAWSEDTTLNFSDEGGGTTSGAVSDGGDIQIEARALDHLPECQSATYIKMDIEGSELEALKGAEKLLKSNRPKLAICLYHQPQDLFEIPLYIKKLDPSYKLYIHHHNVCCAFETVLYAV